jgi:hypothetical protein
MQILSIPKKYQASLVTTLFINLRNGGKWYQCPAEHHFAFMGLCIAPQIENLSHKLPWVLPSPVPSALAVSGSCPTFIEFTLV